MKTTTDIGFGPPGAYPSPVGGKGLRGYSVVIAAADTEASLKSGADVVCGGTDDHAVVQAVVGDPSSLRATTVLLLPGNYEFNDNRVDLFDPLGEQPTHLFGYGATIHRGRLWMADQESSIRGVTLTVPDSYSAGIEINGERSLVLDTTVLPVSGLYSGSIGIGSYARHTKVKRCRLSDFSYGLAFWSNNQYTSAVSNHIVGGDGHAISAAPLVDSAMLIAGNYIETSDPDSEGIHIQGIANQVGLRIVDNHLVGVLVSGVGANVGLYCDARRALVANNHISGNWAIGLYVSDIDNLVVDNFVSGGYYGQIEAGGQSYIQGNTLRVPGGTGIYRDFSGVMMSHNDLLGIATPYAGAGSPFISVPDRT